VFLKERLERDRRLGRAELGHPILGDGEDAPADASSSSPSPASASASASASSLSPAPGGLITNMPNDEEWDWDDAPKGDDWTTMEDESDKVMAQMDEFTFHPETYDKRAVVACQEDPNLKALMQKIDDLISSLELDETAGVDEHEWLKFLEETGRRDPSGAKLESANLKLTSGTVAGGAKGDEGEGERSPRERNERKRRRSAPLARVGCWRPSRASAAGAIALASGRSVVAPSFALASAWSPARAQTFAPLEPRPSLRSAPLRSAPLRLARLVSSRPC
jgi:hypothetical protein